MQWNDDRWMKLAGISNDDRAILSEGVKDDLFSEADDDINEIEPNPPLPPTPTTTSPSPGDVVQGTRTSPPGATQTIMAGDKKRIKKESRRNQRLVENKLRKLIREEIKNYMKGKKRRTRSDRSNRRTTSDLSGLDLHQGTSGYASGYVHGSTTSRHSYRPRVSRTLGFTGPGFRNF